MAPPQGNDMIGRSVGRRSVLAGMAAIGAAAAVGCSRVSTADTTGGGNLLERLRAQGSVKLGIAGEIPFGYISKQAEITGEAPELAKVIFKRLGVPNVQAVPTEFGSLIPGLNSQQFDVIAAGMFVNPERCAQVLFADPDYEVLDAFIVRKGNPKNIQSYADIKKSGAKLASGTAYAEIDYAVDAGVPRGEIQIYPDQLAGLLAVAQGRADAFAGTSLTVRNVINQTKNQKVEGTKPFLPKLDGKPAYGAGAFAFRKGETQLRDAFNEELHKMKKNGEVQRVLKPFGFTDTEMTELTAEELCKK
ncbi:ectoine/hydroxyectoine ABC transporter substrate-binding protein EhuB [Streptomyces sp. NPDC048639]|uniref:ectoine/hydroxyectoine ABC transporter substrate-binding protein EhuB n=1 Tax=Streptomyces sp. NPDC048639 TaxID=3365581 RepID=UPI00371AA1E2